MQNVRLAEFSGRILIIGFGSVGQGVLPLLLRHIAIDPQRISIITDDPEGSTVAGGYGVSVEVLALTRLNLRSVLSPRLAGGDLVLNLAVNVSSVALLELCRDLSVLYVDTSIEPWAGGYLDPLLPPADRTNYALREAALRLRGPHNQGPTAILTHGANPGLVSHFLKQALLNLGTDTALETDAPKQR
ncbi:MAG: saccharopine dehydrogenase NADP-binding domain-containing protein, partial [Pseudomonadales bacterium]